MQPNNFPTAKALEVSLKEFITSYNQTAKLINWTYTVEKLEQKLGVAQRKEVRKPMFSLILV